MRVLGRTNGLDNVQVEGAGKLPVTLIVGGHSHNRAGTVTHQHIVGNEQRQLLAVNRIGGPQAGKHASLFTV